MTRDLPVTVSFIYGWWDQHFYGTYARPVVPSDDELERVYLERKRFLFEHFGSFGIGEEHPVPDGKCVNVVTKWCVDFIPYLMGVNLRCQEQGFWSAEPLPQREIAKLRPVNLAEHPFAEWILGRKARLTRKYGRADIGQTLEGSVNAACRIRGQELYHDLVANKELARHLLAVITQTVIQTYEFFAREFELAGIMLANCSNAHIGPDRYEEMCLPNDIRIVDGTRHLFNRDRYASLHHCDTSADKFIGLYRTIPAVETMDGGYPTDIRMVKETMPGVKFSAMINPMALQQLTAPLLQNRILELLAAGADALFIANIDPRTEIDAVRVLFRCIADSCEAAGCRPVFSVSPFADDEYEWAFPRYQGDRINHCTDDWRRLIPHA